MSSSSDDQPPGKPPGDPATTLTGVPPGGVDRGSKRTLPPPTRGPAGPLPRTPSPATLPPQAAPPQAAPPQAAPPPAQHGPAQSAHGTMLFPPPPTHAPAPVAAAPPHQPAPIAAPPPTHAPAPVAAPSPYAPPVAAPPTHAPAPVAAPSPYAPPGAAPSPFAPPTSGPVPYPPQDSGPTMPNAGAPPHAASGPVPYPNQPSGPTQPYPGGIVPPANAPYPSTVPPQSSAPSPYAPQPSGGIPHSHSGPSFGQPTFGGSGPTAHDPAFAGPPPASVVTAGQYQGPDAGDSLDEIPGSQFVNFLKISARRAFRLRIEPSEVLPAERRSLLRASPPITDLSLQSFLAWRRSLLFLVVCALVPLTVIGLIDALTSTKYKAIFFVKFMPAFAELVFLAVCWSQLKRWEHWRTQRRKLFYGWLLFMLTPFVVFIYPLNTIEIGIDGVYKQAVLPFVFSMLAMLQLAPKAISLMPGLIRSSMVIKLLFPGSSAPGWLIVMASPMYALLAYVILIIPYQFTGSGWFVAGILGVIAAQSVLARAGFQLARPLSEEEALFEIKKVRRYYISVMILSAVLIIIALGSLVSKLDLRATDVILAVLKFESNVLILTMIGADLVVTNLDKARHYTAGRDHVEDMTENKIAAFVSFEAPLPPPSGPAT